MGLADQTGTRLSVGGRPAVSGSTATFPLWPGPLNPPGEANTCYLMPCRSSLNITRRISMGMGSAYGPDHEPWVVDTHFSCLCTLEA